MKNYILTEQQANQAANDTKVGLSNIVQKSLNTYEKGKDCVKAAKDAAEITKFVVQVIKNGKVNKQQLTQLAANAIKKGVEDKANKGLKQLGDKLKNKISILPDDAEFKIKLNTDFKNISADALAKSVLDASFEYSQGGFSASANRKQAGAKYKKGGVFGQVSKNYKGGATATAGAEFTFESKNKSDMKIIMENWRKYLSYES